MHQHAHRSCPFRKGSPLNRRSDWTIYLSAIVLITISTSGDQHNVAKAASEASEYDTTPLFMLTVNANDATACATQNQGEKDSTQRARRNRDFKFSLKDEDDVRRLLCDFPDLANVATLNIEYENVASIPDVLLERIAEKGKNLRQLIIGRWSSPERALATISDAGMESVSRMANLDTLALGCHFSAKGFTNLTKLRKLEVLSIHKPTFGAQDCFEVVSKLPEIRVLGIHRADLSQPIGAETFKAIASLNGRLEDLNFGEWQETTIHASMIPAIAEIKSLTHLYLGEMEGSLPKPQAHYLKNLPYLERLEPYGTEETAGAIALQGLRTRDGCPVQFRKVKSPAEMVVLLRFVLGTAEANKVRREVVQRRAGLSPRPEGYPRTKYALQTIFEKSFDAKLSRNAIEILPYITSQYPELDSQIRRYLAGEDFVGEEEGDGEPKEARAKE